MPVESNASVASLADLARRPEGPSVEEIWLALTPGERQESLKYYIASDPSSRESLIGIAGNLPALRSFRRQTIKQMPDSRLAEIIAKAGKFSPGLIHDALLAFHLIGRTAMLESFLDLLAIPHSAGVISDAGSVADAVQGDRLAKAVTQLLTQYPARDVLIYLLALIAMDPDSWGGLRPLVAEHAGAN